MLSEYTPQQARIDRAFSHGGSCCSVYCEACGRTYFVTSEGHGDYEDGELAELYERAEKEPDKCIEVPDFSCVATMRFNGRQLVIGCECDPTKQLSEWIETHAEQLTRYLREYWTDKKLRAAREATDAKAALRALETDDKSEPGA